MPAAFEALKKRSTYLQQLGNVQAVLAWDMETRMPRAGAQNRSNQMAALSEMLHTLWTSDETAGLIQAAKEEASEQTSLYDKGLLRVMTRDYDQATKLPAVLVTAMAQTETQAHGIWVEARKNNDFTAFAPILKTLLEQKRQMAEFLSDGQGSLYDALLDQYEPGLSTKQLDPLFADLKAQLVPLIQAIRNANRQPDTDFIHQSQYDVDKQRAFTREILTAMGFNFDSVRLEEVPHPCCSGTGPGDLAIGTRFLEDDLFSGISSSIHEGGHGLYDEGVDPEISSTPLAGGASLGIHESQSRLWENLVGRSRNFWTCYWPRLQNVYPEALQGISLEQFYAAINVVQPSFIRVEADEATYNLHIMVRYEIEKDLIEGRLEVNDIPKAWNARMQDYLGITPANDAQGCLQDVHWSMGGFGYFPTYTLGNLYSVQFFNAAKRALPDLDQQLAQGNLIPLKTWLNENIHKNSKAELPHEIVQRVTGEPLNARYFVDYLWEKFTPLYGLNRP